MGLGGLLTLVLLTGCPSGGSSSADNESSGLTQEQIEQRSNAQSFFSEEELFVFDDQFDFVIAAAFSFADGEDSSYIMQQNSVYQGYVIPEQW